MIMLLFKPLNELSLARFGGIVEKVLPNLSPLGVGELAASLFRGRRDCRGQRKELACFRGRRKGWGCCRGGRSFFFHFVLRMSIFWM
jgi:hypothetical protein